MEGVRGESREVRGKKDWMRLDGVIRGEEQRRASSLPPSPLHPSHFHHRHQSLVHDDDTGGQKFESDRDANKSPPTKMG